MDDSQRALRRAADEAFSRSLDQLGVCFQPEGEASLAAQPFEDQSVMPNAASHASSLETLPLQSLEDAAADIERLFRHRQN